MSFYVRLAVFSAVIAAGFFAYNHYAPSRFVHPLGWAVFGLFVLVTVLVHLIITRPGLSPQQFVRTYMATTTIKLFLFLFLLVIYGFIDGNSAFVFIFHFLVFYLLFTAFEAVMLYKHFRSGR